MGINLTTYDDKYYNNSFKTLVRSNKKYLISKCTIYTFTEKDIANANKNDFYKLCNNRGIPHNLIWVCAYINDIEDPFEEVDLNKLMSLKIVNESTLNDMLQRSNTIKG